MTRGRHRLRRDAAPAHLPHGLLAMEAGKHVLVEKPVALSAEEARVIADLAAETGLFCAEALWTLFLPKLDVVRQVLDGGLIGEVARCSPSTASGSTTTTASSARPRRRDAARPGDLPLVPDPLGARPADRGRRPRHRRPQRGERPGRRLRYAAAPSVWSTPRCSRARPAGLHDRRFGGHLDRPRRLLPSRPLLGAWT